MADESFREFVCEQLAGLPGIEFRRMFGGEGLYLGETFFGILYQGRLYFKTDATSRPDFDAAGMGPFQPNAKQCLSAYREVPAAVLEDAANLCTWARRAAQCQAAPAKATRGLVGRQASSRTAAGRKPGRESAPKTRSSTRC